MTAIICLLSSLKLMNNKHKIKYPLKPFPHFDSQLKITTQVQKNLQDPHYIKSHSFYPFINYTKTTRKFTQDKVTKEKKLSDPKTREIYYASHMDGYIFRYYGEILNNKYNLICGKKNIDYVSLAYRNNRRGQNNIHFSAEVISFLSQQKEAFIFVSDFSKYFDNLNHTILKQKLIETLNCGLTLPDDWWNIFRHITKFSWVKKEIVLKDLEEKDGQKRSKTNKERYYTPQQFRKFRKKVKINRNTTNKGIPQGTAISAVLANVYAIDLDVALNQYAQAYGGIYRRYSDDIILILPNSIFDLTHENNIRTIIKENKVDVGEGKTSSLYYIDQNIYINSDCSKLGKLDYLGFSFDGKKVQIREKSLYKYYHRAYKKIKSINNASYYFERKIKRKVGRRKLYSLYTHLGINYKGYGNFITYSRKAHSIFSEISGIESKIAGQTKRHWTKIQKRIRK
ncbi:reverse transcriptase domain-containing protein [Paenibacillus wenxiniae]|uniref:Reverse transcriptase domain-containing protein n=1 Tax=Paenibacillus wenxiniae TaxID=1636843 RepID=A0ABW4RH50_9BACL